MATGPSCGCGKAISLWEKLVWEKLVTDPGSNSGFPVKLIDRGIARIKLIDNRTEPPIKGGYNPKIAAVAPQTTPPRAIAPWETMMTVAFMRPRDSLASRAALQPRVLTQTTSTRFRQRQQRS